MACSFIAGGSPTLANALNPQSFYTIPPQYFTPYTYTPLTPYGGQQQTQWISSYSSLNGATSNQSTSQPQRSPVQQIQSPILQHSPPPQQSTSQQQYSPPHMSPLQQHLSIEYVFFFIDFLSAGSSLRMPQPLSDELKLIFSDDTFSYQLCSPGILLPESYTNSVP